MTGPFQEILVRPIGAMGRSVIPASFRAELDLTEGTPVAWELDAANRRIIIRPAAIADVLTELAAQPYSSNRLNAILMKVREGMNANDFMDELRKMRVDYVL